MYKSRVRFDLETTTTSHVLAGLPSGLLEGDVLVMLLCSQGGYANTPSGWTRVYAEGTGSEKIAVYVKEATEEEELEAIAGTASLTVTFGTGTKLAAVIYRLGGGVTTSKLSVSAEGYEASGNTPLWGALTPPDNGEFPPVEESAYYMGWSAVGGLSEQSAAPAFTEGYEKIGIFSGTPDTVDYAFASGMTVYGTKPSDANATWVWSGGVSRWTAGGMWIQPADLLSRHYVVAQAVKATLRDHTPLTDVIPGNRWRLQKKAWHRQQRWTPGAYVVPMRRMNPAHENVTLRWSMPVLVAVVFPNEEGSLTASIAQRMAISERIEDIFAHVGRKYAPAYLTDLDSVYVGDQAFKYEKCTVQPGDVFMEGAFADGFDAAATLVNVDVISGKVNYSSIGA